MPYLHGSHVLNNVGHVFPSDIVRELLANAFLSLPLDNSLVVATIGDVVIRFDEVCIAWLLLVWHDVGGMGWVVIHIGRFRRVPGYMAWKIVDCGRGCF